MVLFKANEKPNLEESTKIYGNVSVRQIRKINATCEIHGEKSDECRKILKEAGLNLVDE